MTPQPNGESSKVKVKVRMTSNGIFAIINASMYEKLDGMEEEEDNKESMDVDEDGKKKDNGTGDNSTSREVSTGQG